MNEIPDFLNKLLINEYGKELSDEIIDGFKCIKPTTFRVNTLKASVEEIKKELDTFNVKYKDLSKKINKEISFLEEEYRLQDLDIYKDGKIYIQSLSSMIPAIILDPKEKENILDMCAAPGRQNDSDSILVF